MLRVAGSSQNSGKASITARSPVLVRSREAGGQGCADFEARLAQDVQCTSFALEPDDRIEVGVHAPRGNEILMRIRI